jgi:addiction module RelE/StbE family toxin
VVTYSIVLERHLEKQLQKLAKKAPSVHTNLLNKVHELSERPNIGKPLRGKYKGVWRVHIGSFVLKYSIDEERKELCLLTFEHHDEAYI